MAQSINPERVRQSPNPFRVESELEIIPKVLATLEPWAGISERLRRMQLNLSFERMRVTRLERA